MNSDKLLTCMYIVSRENEKYIEARDEDNKKEISPQHNKSQKKTTKPPVLTSSQTSMRQQERTAKEHAAVVTALKGKLREAQNFLLTPSK